jgi:hypothetical protein
MANRYDIHTIDDVARFFGGQRGMQERFALSQPAVSHWKRRGIPTGYHMRIALEVQRAGLTINPELFELDEPLAGLLNSWRASDNGAAA